MKIEPITQQQVDALIKAMGFLSAMVCSLGDADILKGRGVLENKEGNTKHCLWTKDRRRITVTLCSDGGLLASCGKTPDPECP